MPRSSDIWIGSVAALLGCAIALAGCRTGVFKEYEYEEEIYLSLDGSATVYVNGSVPALVALRGLVLDPNPRARLDRGRVRALYSSAVSRVSRVSSSRRHGRRFVHVRLEVDDIRQLSRAAPFAWSTYALGRTGDLYAYRQVVGPPPVHVHPALPPSVGWNGSEIVAFRVHLPSKIRYHDAREMRRGNILVWEQTLASRRAGAVVRMEARMETESILYRTLSLFGVMLGLVAIAFVSLLWWVRRKGKEAV